MSGILDCVMGYGQVEFMGRGSSVKLDGGDMGRGSCPAPLLVNNAHVFARGMQLEVRKTVDGPRVGMIEVIDVKEKVKTVRYIMLGNFYVPKVGDLLIYDDAGYR